MVNKYWDLAGIGYDIDAIGIVPPPGGGLIPCYGVIV